MKHCGTKQLETKRLILRRFVIDDADAMFRNWASDSEVTKYLTWPTHASVEVTSTILNDWVNSYKKDNYYQWAIILKENGNEPIGCIGVNELKEKIEMAHMGYCMGKTWWHKGIMSEALQAVIDFLFDEVEVNRIESRFDPNNHYSGAVMKKCGMKYEGTLKAADWNNQGICDASYYGLVRAER